MLPTMINGQPSKTLFNGQPATITPNYVPQRTNISIEGMLLMRKDATTGDMIPFLFEPMSEQELMSLTLNAPDEIKPDLLEFYRANGLLTN